MQEMNQKTIICCSDNFDLIEVLNILEIFRKFLVFDSSFCNLLSVEARRKSLFSIIYLIHFVHENNELNI
jgi:hypothetical protein